MYSARQLAIVSLIVVCAAVFGFEQLQGTTFAEDYGVIPVRIVSAARQLVNVPASVHAIGELTRLVTSQFVHGDVEHLLYNMVFLWVFGVLVADVLGQWWALLGFLVCGICGGLLHVYLNSDSIAPMIGASGSISGLAGIYLGIALRWRLPWPQVWPLAHPVPPLQVGAFAVLGFLGDMVLLANHDQHIAYGAHIGGFLSGVAIAAVVTTVFPNFEDYRRARKLR